MTAVDAVAVDGEILEEGSNVYHSRLGRMEVVGIRESDDEIRVRFDVLDVPANQWMCFRLEHVREAWGDTMDTAPLWEATDAEVAQAYGGTER